MLTIKIQPSSSCLFRKGGPPRRDSSLERIRRKLKGSDGGDRQTVNPLSEKPIGLSRGLSHQNRPLIPVRSLPSANMGASCAQSAMQLKSRAP
jgi:hypothetical protein